MKKITDAEIRLIGADSEQLGVVSIEDALNAAYEQDLDLVEVAANAAPPVCRIMDYGDSFQTAKATRRGKTRSASKSKRSNFVRERTRRLPGQTTQPEPFPC